MPLFEFTCRACGHRFEELMTLGELEKDKPACPECASRKVERGFSSFATGVASGGGAPAPGCGSGGFT